MLIPVDGLKSGLIACFELNEASGSSVSDSFASNTANLYGTYSLNVAGKISTCLELDGSSGEMRSSLGNFSKNNPFSFSFWLNPSDLQEDVTYQLFDRRTSLLKGYALDMMYSGGQCTFYFRLANNYLSASYVSGSISISENNWYHVVCTYSGNSNVNGAEIFINGSSISTANNLELTDIGTSGETLYVGRSRGGSDFFPGKIDQFAIWSKKLSSSEFAQLYNSGNGLAYTLWN